MDLNLILSILFYIVCFLVGWFAGVNKIGIFSLKEYSFKKYKDEHDSYKKDIDSK